MTRFVQAEDIDAKAKIFAEAGRLGLDPIGVARIDGGALTALRLKTFLDEGRHGDMDWMAENAERRGDPAQLWPEARSAIMVGQSYAPKTNPLDSLEETDKGSISVYAQGRDYHDVLKRRMKQLARFIAAETKCDVKVFVDTAPLMEKPLAARSGIGWQGKNTNLVSRAHGSWLFLGAILTTAELAPDDAETDRCGSCTRCLDICPTRAFPAPYQLDARRCLAYLSIEHKGTIAREFRVPMGNRVFGCDDCLAVCPWNKFAEEAREQQYAAKAGSRLIPLSELLVLDDPAFRIRFAGTPVKRTGRNRVVRNALIAAGNSGDAALLKFVIPLLDDGSPLVRAMAIWALRRLASPEQIDAHKARSLAHEADADVRSEWEGALTADHAA